MISSRSRKVPESRREIIPDCPKVQKSWPALARTWPERGTRSYGIDRACPCSAEYAMKEISIFRPRRATLSVDTGYHDNTPLPPPSPDGCNESAAVTRENGRLPSSYFSSSLLLGSACEAGSRARAHARAREREREREVLRDDNARN
jgi:hypothetical protein